MSKFKELTRPILSYIAIIGLTAGFFMGMVPSSAYVPCMITIILYWFQTRDKEKAKE